MRKNICIAAVFVLACSTAFAAGWLARGKRAEREAASIGLSTDLFRLGYSANALTTLQKQNPGQHERLLWLGIQSATDSAERHLASGGQLYPKLSYTHLLESLNRAQRVAEAANDKQLSARLLAIKQKLVGPQ